MGLTRVTNPMATALIRRLGDGGGALTRDVELELDALINWAKLSPRCIHRDTATTNSTGAGPDTLHTFSLPAGSLATNGDFVELEYSGIFAADDDNKAIRAVFGGTEYVNRGLGATDFDGIIGWVVRATIIRLTSTSVRASASLISNLLYGDSANAFTGTSGNGGLASSSVLDITGLSDLGANATTMSCQSLGVNAADVSQRLSVVKLCQQ